MEEKFKIEAANGDLRRLRSSLNIRAKVRNLLDSDSADPRIWKQALPKNGKPTDRWAF
jgi:hypothetical protein